MHSALQNRFSYLLPRPPADLYPHVLLDDDVAAVLREAGMLALGYSPVLEGAYVRPDRPLHHAYGDRELQATPLEALDEVARAVGLDAGQTELAWMTQGAEPDLPVVALSTIKQLEAAWHVGIDVDTLRWFERRGVLPRPVRTAAGHRRYRADDVHLIEVLMHLRRTRMPLREIAEFTALVQRDPDGVDERLALLREHHRRVVEDQRALAVARKVIEQKITDYRARL